VDSTDLTAWARQSGDAIVLHETFDRGSYLPTQILQISLSHRVNTADLDLATEVGTVVLEKRVKDAAMAACVELGKKYPFSTPSDADCAKEAAGRAMIKAREFLAKARQAPHSLSATVLQPQAGHGTTSTVVAAGE
jgi:UrcA family protein